MLNLIIFYEICFIYCETARGRYTCSQSHMIDTHGCAWSKNSKDGGVDGTRLVREQLFLQKSNHMSNKINRSLTNAVFRLKKNMWMCESPIKKVTWYNLFLLKLQKHLHHPPSKNKWQAQVFLCLKKSTIAIKCDGEIFNLKTTLNISIKSRKKNKKEYKSTVLNKKFYGNDQYKHNTM